MSRDPWQPTPVCVSPQTLPHKRATKPTEKERGGTQGRKVDKSVGTPTFNGISSTEDRFQTCSLILLSVYSGDLAMRRVLMILGKLKPAAPSLTCSAFKCDQPATCHQTDQSVELERGRENISNSVTMLVDHLSLPYCLVKPHVSFY